MDDRKYFGKDFGSYSTRAFLTLIHYNIELLYGARADDFIIFILNRPII